jgi:tRNA pseudouridine38-40 synthase
VNPELERRFRLTVHYDGTYFFGWQLQARGRTVQGEMEAALKRLTGTRQPVLAAGRTDSGVHATGQVVAVTLPIRWDVHELHRGLNATLPGDIWVESTLRADPAFHPRFDARARSYRYQFGMSHQAFSPFFRPWCWPLLREVDIDLLHRAAALLVGEHSFKAFAKVGQEARGDRCRVSEARWVPWGDVGLAFEVTANRFLHHMVRYLMGTMVDVGRERRPLEDIQELLFQPDTELTTSPPAPPEGLFLAKVHYPETDSELNLGFPLTPSH